MRFSKTKRKNLASACFKDQNRSLKTEQLAGGSARLRGAPDTQARST
jgi:hypothetical protein